MLVVAGAAEAKATIILQHTAKHPKERGIFGTLQSISGKGHCGIENVCTFPQSVWRMACQFWLVHDPWTLT